MKKIIFTGGGSGGHVVPAITLINYFKKQNIDLDILYIGGKTGIEKELISKIGIKYKGISTGKLRRYLSFQNFLDLFKIFWGLIESIITIFLFKNKKTLLFGTGGFVSVGPVLAAKFCGVKVIIHEQTSRAGLANRICSKFADEILISFESSHVYFPKSKTNFTGIPLRDDVFSSDINISNFTQLDLASVNKPILFITGGGNGSLLLNNWVEGSMEELKKNFFIIHQVGQKFINDYKKFEDECYLPLDFIHGGMIDLFKVATIVISRAGANTVQELICLGKKSFFVPLKIAQKNEQFHNAKLAQEKLGSVIIEEDDVKEQKLSDLISSINIDDFKSFSPLKENPTKTISEKILKNLDS